MEIQNQQHYKDKIFGIFFLGLVTIIFSIIVNKIIQTLHYYGIAR